MAEHEVKVDPMAKVVTGVGVLVLLVAVAYLVVALVGTVNKNTTRGPVMTEPVATAPAATPVTSAEAVAAPASTGAGDAVLGKAAYTSCAACHGAAGEGAGMFPKLVGTPTDKFVDLMKKYRAGEAVGANSSMMIPNAKSLSDADIDNLAAYVAGMGGAAPAATSADSSPEAPAAAQAATGGVGNAALGKAAYASCAACHGAAGEGAGMFPKLVGTPTDKFVDLMKKYRAGETVGANSAMMIPNAKSLSDADIDNLAAYVAGMGGAADAGAGAPVAAAAPAEIDQAVLARGKAIYTSCALCHGVEDAQTSRLLNSPMIVGYPASAVLAMMKNYKEGKSSGPNSSFMWPVAQGLDEEDTAAVAAYISSLPIVARK